MKRLSIALALFALAAACTGPRGNTGATGATGSPGPTGTQGPPGPITVPPHITSITPQYGSSKTIFTITGDHFGASAAEDQLTLDGIIATGKLLSATATSIQFTGAFDPVDEVTALPVTIQVADQLSNPVVIYGMPSGSIHDFGLEANVFGKVSSSALSADGKTLYVADQARGLFAQNLATGTQTPVVLNGQSGVTAAMQVYVTPSFATPPGALMLLDQNANGAFHLLAQQSDGAWAEAFRFYDYTLPTQIAFGTGGNVYVVYPSYIELFPANLVYSNTSETYHGAVYQGGELQVSLYATFGTTVYYDLCAVNPLAMTFAGCSYWATNTPAIAPTLLTGDGASTLYTANPSGLSKVDISVPGAYVVTPFPGWPGVDYSGVWYPGVTSLSLTAAGELLVTDSFNPDVAKIDPNPAKPTSIAAAGLYGDRNWTSISVTGNGMVGNAGICFSASSSTTVGAILDFSGGVARTVPTSGCPGALVADETSVVFADVFGMGVYRYSRADGTVTTLLTPVAGIQPLGLAEAADGTIFATEYNANVPQTQITSIAPNGTVATAIGTLAGGAWAWSGAISGNRLFVMGEDASGYGLFTMPLTQTGGQPLTRLTSPSITDIAFNMSFPDGLTADGAGGVYFNNMAYAQILDVAADGAVTALSGTGYYSASITRDPASGNLRVLDANFSGLARPVEEMFP